MKRNHSYTHGYETGKHNADWLEQSNMLTDIPTEDYLSIKAKGEYPENHNYWSGFNLAVMERMQACDMSGK